MTQEWNPKEMADRAYPTPPAQAMTAKERQALIDALFELLGDDIGEAFLEDAADLAIHAVFHSAARQTWEAERAALLRRIEDKAREFAAHYDQGSDGRNTFVMFAEWIKELKP